MTTTAIAIPPRRLLGWRLLERLQRYFLGGGPQGFPRYTGGGGYLPIIITWYYANSAVDLDFENNRLWTPGGGENSDFTTYLSISRASTAYATNSAGTLTSFGTHTLRITDLGLLVEGARTNLILRSQEAENAAWNSNNALTTTGVDAIAAPDGTTTADKIIPNTAVTAHYLGQNGITTSAATAYSMSIYVKAAGYGFVGIAFTDNTDTHSVRVNLTNGGILGAADPDYLLADVQSVETLDSGWYRIRITKNSAAATANAAVFIFPLDTSGRMALDGFAGDDTSGIYVWGIQFEAGAFASSYVPTTGASATRAADAITITGTAQSTINAAAASIVGQVKDGALSAAANLVDSNGTNVLGFNASNNAIASIISTLTTGNTATHTTTEKLGLGWNASGRSLVLNGGTVATDAIAQTPSATQRLGSASGSSNFIYGYVERLTLWNSRLGDSQLQIATTP
jgi:hypothetical protein